nr:hypothetical protein [Tanacetum cinerariifolium]
MLYVDTLIVTGSTCLGLRMMSRLSLKNELIIVTIKPVPVSQAENPPLSLELGLAGQAPEKETKVDLFYLHSMDRGTANISYLLAQYLFSMIRGGRVELGCLGVTSLDVLQLILDWLNIYERIGDTWAWVASRLERNPDATTGSLRATKDTLAVDDGAHADQHPCRHLVHRHLPPVLCSREFTGLRRRYKSYDRALWCCEEMLLDRSLIRQVCHLDGQLHDLADGC